MQREKAVDATGIVTRLVQDLAMERDPVRLLRHALDTLRGDLGAEALRAFDRRAVADRRVVAGVEPGDAALALQLAKDVDGQHAVRVRVGEGRVVAAVRRLVALAG